MRILVDEMPDVKENCPFHRMVMYINDAYRMKNYCTLSGKQCDLSLKTGCRTTCSCLSIVTDSRVMRYD